MTYAAYATIAGKTSSSFSIKSVTNFFGSAVSFLKRLIMPKTIDDSASFSAVRQMATRNIAIPQCSPTNSDMVKVYRTSYGLVSVAGNKGHVTPLPGCHLKNESTSISSDTNSEYHTPFSSPTLLKKYVLTGDKCCDSYSERYNQGQTQGQRLSAPQTGFGLLKSQNYNSFRLAPEKVESIKRDFNGYVPENSKPVQYKHLQQFSPGMAIKSKKTGKPLRSFEGPGYRVELLNSLTKRQLEKLRQTYGLSELNSKNCAKKAGNQLSGEEEFMLGTGGYGTVKFGLYDVLDEHGAVVSTVPVAIKKVSVDSGNVDSQRADKGRAMPLDRLEAEVAYQKKASELGLAPNIYDFRVEPDHDGKPTAYLTLELMPGGTLWDVSKAGRMNTSTRAQLNFLGQLTSSVSTFHQHGIFHRDIKSDNVIFVPGRAGADAQISILDFGVASSSDQCFFLNASLVGNVQSWHIPPEQYGNKRYDTGKCSVFQLGMLMAEVFYKDDVKHLLKDIDGYLKRYGPREAGMVAGLFANELARCLRARYPNNDLVKLITRMLSSEPDCRPDFGQIQLELQRIGAYYHFDRELTETAV